VVKRFTTHEEWRAMVFVNNKLIEKTFSVQKEKKIKHDIQQEVYDPRVKRTINSDNPALIVAEIITKSKFIKVTDDFWQNIKILADYCDQRI